MPAESCGGSGVSGVRVAARATSIAHAAREFVASRWAELAVGLLAAALYLPSIGYGFVFDDAALIAPDGSPLAVGGIVPYRPLRYASYLVDYALGGTPAIYHAHNVLLHALVAALVVAVARRLGSPRAAAMAGGLLVATHPLAVEAAAYVAGRRDLLCVALGLCAVLMQLSGRFAMALVFVVLATAAKESGLVFIAPLAAASIAGLDGRASAPRRRVFGAAAGMAAAGGIAAAVTSGLALALAYGAIGPWAPAADAAGLALPGRVLAHYLGALVGAVPLSPEYPELLGFVARLQGAEALANSGITVLLAMVAAASLAACVRSGKRRRGREGAFVFAWTMAVVVALAVWGGLHEPGADRHAYLLLAPLGVALAAVLSRLRLGDAAGRKSRRAAPALLRSAVVAGVILTLLGSASASRRQMEIWRSERTLWTHASADPSASPRAHANMARSLARDGDYGAAVRHMNSALAADPSDPQLYLGRAAVRCAQQRRFHARRDLRRARHLGASAPLVAELVRDCGLGAL